MAKNLKVMILLLFLCLFLVACGELKVGDMFTLKRNVVGGINITSMENVSNQISIFEEMGELDSVEEHLDLGEITSFSVGEVVLVTEIKHNLVQLQSINPKTEGNVKLWINKEELKDLE